MSSVTHPESHRKPRLELKDFVVPSELRTMVREELGETEASAEECCEHFKKDIQGMIEIGGSFSAIAEQIKIWQQERLINTHPRRRPAAAVVFGSSHKPLGGYSE